MNNYNAGNYLSLHDCLIWRRYIAPRRTLDYCLENCLENSRLSDHVCTNIMRYGSTVRPKEKYQRFIVFNHEPS